MILLENVLNISLQDILKMSWRRLEDIFKTSWRHMANMNILVLTKASWRQLEDIFWRHKAKGNIFVLMKTSWRPLEDVFWRRRRKTSSRRLQDVFIKTNVCWVNFSHDSELKLWFLSSSNLTKTKTQTTPKLKIITRSFKKPIQI